VALRFALWQIGFSPDGRFIMSGDGEGRLWFWDWKTCKVFRTLKCSESVCIGCEWHPLEQSKVATCGWDGLIKYWCVHCALHCAPVPGPSLKKKANAVGEGALWGREQALWGVWGNSEGVH